MTKLTKFKLFVLYTVLIATSISMIFILLDKYQPDNGELIGIYSLALLGIVTLIDMTNQSSKNKERDNNDSKK